MCSSWYLRMKLSWIIERWYYYNHREMNLYWISPNREQAWWVPLVACAFHEFLDQACQESLVETNDLHDVGRLKRSSVCWCEPGPGFPFRSCGSSRFWLGAGWYLVALIYEHTQYRNDFITTWDNRILNFRRKRSAGAHFNTPLQCAG